MISCAEVDVCTEGSPKRLYLAELERDGEGLGYFKGAAYRLIKVSKIVPYPSTTMPNSLWVQIVQIVEVQALNLILVFRIPF